MNEPALRSVTTCHPALAAERCNLPHVKLKVFGRMLDIREVPVKITERHWAAYRIGAAGQNRMMGGKRITHKSSSGGVGRVLGGWALLCCHVGECSHASLL